MLSVGVVCANDNLTQDLNSNIEDTANYGNSDSEKTFKDITRQIDESKENDVIMLDGKYVSEGSEIKINKKLTFRGENDTILDGNKSSRIISASKDVTFDNITFMNGYSTEGGSIISGKANLTFINCIFINNVKVGKDVDDIYLENYYQANVYSKKSINLVNCTFKDNSDNAQLVRTDDVLTVKNSRFENNNAPNVIFQSWNGEAVVSNSRFSNNKIVIQSFGKLTVTNCEFNKNRWVMDCSGSENKISNSNFYNNKYCISFSSDSSAYSIIINRCNFINSTGYGLNVGAKAVVRNSNFINNKNAFKTYSYGYYEDYVESIPSVSFTNCLFKSNTECAVKTHFHTTVKNCTFESNKGSLAGAIYCYVEDYGLKNTVKISDSTFKNNDADYAGAIKVEGSQVTVSNTKFTKNKLVSIIATNVECFGHDKYDRYAYMAKVTVDSKSIGIGNFKDNLKKVSMVKLTVSKKVIKTSYYSGKKLVIKAINRLTNKPISKLRINIDAKNGKKINFYHVSTNKKGIAKFSASILPVGTNKITIHSDYGVCISPKLTRYVKITKGKTIVSAPKVTNKYKKSAYFKITVKNKVSKVPTRFVNLNLKIGQKTYKVNTDNKGIVKFNTKNLGYGTHKVTISSASANYIISAQSSIKIV